MKKLGLAFIAALAAVPFGMFACSGDDSTATASDAGTDGVLEAATPEAAATDGPLGTLPDAAPKVSCKLDNGPDPVAFCIQKQALEEQNTHGFDPARGALASWSSSSPYAADGDDAGAPLHDLRDDLAYGAALAAYHSSAAIYGDTEVTAIFDAQLLKIAKIVLTEFGTSPPADYDGDIYARLRAIAGGLRLVNDTDDANKLDALADAFARTIFAQYVHAASVPVDGGSADAGSASAVVIGIDKGGGVVAYDPALVATAALALLDMAGRHIGDDPTNATKWTNAAMGSFDYLASRAKDGPTGLYYAHLHTSADAGHDALDVPAGSPYAADALLSDVQAKIALSLYRASTIALGFDGDGGLAPARGYPFGQRGADLLAALNGPTVSLWDGTGPDAGVVGGSGTGYLEGYVPSTTSYLTNKTTRANALLFAAVRRAEIDGVGAGLAWQLPLLRAVLTAEMGTNASLLTVVPLQTGYLRAATRGFTVAVEPRAASYRAQAIDDACEGLTEFWYGFRR